MDKKTKKDKRPEEGIEEQGTKLVPGAFGMTGLLAVHGKKVEVKEKS